MDLHSPVLTSPLPPSPPTLPTFHSLPSVLSGVTVTSAVPHGDKRGTRPREKLAPETPAHRTRDPRQQPTAARRSPQKSRRPRTACESAPEAIVWPGRRPPPFTCTTLWPASRKGIDDEWGLCCQDPTSRNIVRHRNACWA